MSTEYYQVCLDCKEKLYLGKFYFSFLSDGESIEDFIKEYGLAFVKVSSELHLFLINHNFHRTGKISSDDLVKVLYPTYEEYLAEVNKELKQMDKDAPSVTEKEIYGWFGDFDPSTTAYYINKSNKTVLVTSLCG